MLREKRDSGCGRFLIHFDLVKVWCATARFFFSSISTRHAICCKTALVLSSTLDPRLAAAAAAAARACAATCHERDKAALKAILGTNKLPSEVIDKLLAWKAA